MQLASSEQLEKWDELIAANPDGGAILQLKAFGDIKARHGWSARRYIMDDIAVQIIARSVPYFGELWYVPGGPGAIKTKDFSKFAKAAAKLERPPFLIKVDPELMLESRPLKSPYVKAPRDLQYNSSTAIIDLAPSEDEIIAAFRQKTRYNIRLAAKKGVTVEAVPTTADTIATMYDLYSTTTKRAGVYLRSKAYFSDFWTEYSKSGHGQLFFASFEGKVLAGAFILYTGTKALYKDGGSLREQTSVQAPIALQWGIMQWLKAHGALAYDLHGTPPPDQIDNPEHPLAGLARFKTGFQPHITQFVGTYDLPIDAGKYKKWNAYGERLAVAFEYRIKKQLFY